MALTPLQKGAATTLALSAIALVVAVANPFGGPFGPNGGSGGASFGGSATTFTSTQTDGGPGFCFNGSCGVSFSSDGGVVTLSGAELDATLANSQNVNADTIITPQAVISQAASGQKALGVAHDGARIYFGESGNVYCYNNAGEVTCASAWKIPTVSVDTIGSYTSNRYTDLFRVRMFPTAVGNLGTCNGVAAAGSNPEGLMVAITGASLSGQTRFCACVSDGAGTPAYTWINMGCPNTAGTNTTCPVCP